MFDFIRARWRHGYQAIPDPTKAKVATTFPGLPILHSEDEVVWQNAAAICPSQAIENKQLDLGRCIFCGACQRAYPSVFEFTNQYKMAVSKRESLLLSYSTTEEGFLQQAIQPHPAITKLFGRSFKLRSVSAGGCAACEMELNASSNVNFDISRYGVDLVASPRHADAVVVTGPISANMAEALYATYTAVPKPRLLILAGACAISGGLFAESPALDRSFLQHVEATLYIPGCPVHPLSIVNGIITMLGRS